MREMSKELGLGVALVTLMLCAPARAEAPSGRVRITYMARGDCPTPEGFREAVRQRAPELEDAADGEPARQFVVEATEGGGGARGTVVISEPSGASVTRRLEGDDCREVADALAFIVAELGRAVRIDAEIPGETEPPPAPPPPPPVVPPPPRPVEEPPNEPRKLWEAGAGAEIIGGPAPDLLLAPFGYLELGRARRGSAPLFSARLSFLYSKSGTIDGTIGNADIRWLAARAELCGPRFGTLVLSVGPCAAFDVGELEGSGYGSANPKSEDALWLAPGLSARALLTVERKLVIGAALGAFVPLVRPRFYFAGGGSAGDSETIHTVPSVGFRAALGVGVQFR